MRDKNTSLQKRKIYSNLAPGCLCHFDDLRRLLVVKDYSRDKWYFGNHEKNGQTYSIMCLLQWISYYLCTYNEITIINKYMAWLFKTTVLKHVLSQINKHNTRKYQFNAIGIIPTSQSQSSGYCLYGVLYVLPVTVWVLPCSQVSSQLPKTCQ